MSLHLLTRYGLTRATVGGGAAEPEYGILSIASETTQNAQQQCGYGFDKVGDQDCLGLRARIAANTTLTLRLWRVSDEELLGSVDVTGTNDRAWVEGLFSTSVALTDDARYLVTLRQASGSSFTRINVGSGNYTLNTDRLTHAGLVNSSTDDYPGLDTTSTSVFGVPDVVLAGA